MSHLLGSGSEAFWFQPLFCILLTLFILTPDGCRSRKLSNVVSFYGWWVEIPSCHRMHTRWGGDDRMAHFWNCLPEILDQEKWVWGAVVVQVSEVSWYKRGSWSRLCGMEPRAGLLGILSLPRSAPPPLCAHAFLSVSLQINKYLKNWKIKKNTNHG